MRIYQYGSGLAYTVLAIQLAYEGTWFERVAVITSIIFIIATIMWIGWDSNNS